MGWFKKSKTKEELWFELMASGDTNGLSNYSKDILNIKDKDGNAAVHIAAMHGHTLMLRVLIDQNDVSYTSRNTHNQTPLIMAAMHGRLDALRYLLTKNGGLDTCDVDNHNALHYAVENGHTECVNLLLEKQMDPNAGMPLLVAAENEHSNISLALLDAGAEPNIHDEDYNYPIHHIADSGFEDVLEKLLEKGADIDVTDIDLNTALHRAVNQQHAHIVEMLLKHGARIDMKNSDGLTALELAEESQDMDDDIIDMLEKAEKSERKPEKKKAKNAPAPAPVPAPSIAPVSAKGGDTEEWVLLGQDKIAQVSTHPALGRQITEIFNFTSMDRRVITTNLTLKTESISPAESMDSLSDDMLGEIYDRFKKMGGKADEQGVFKNRMMKKRLGDGSHP